MGRVSAVQVASGFACAGLIFAVLALDWKVTDGWALHLLLVALAVGSSWEMVRMLRGAGHAPCASLAVVGALAPLALTVPVFGSPALLERAAAPLVLVVLIGAVAVQLSRPGPKSAADVAFTLIAAVYPGLTLAYFSLLGRLPPAAGAAGYYVGWPLLFIFVVKANDILAYLLGSALGRRPFSAVSPNKTVEGSLLGFAGGVCVSYAAWLLFGIDGFNWWRPLLFGVAIGPLAQAGDLAESLVKRYAGVKDSGRVVPGSGGVFDFCDCFLLAAPVAWLILAAQTGALRCFA